MDRLVELGARGRDERCADIGSVDATAEVGRVGRRWRGRGRRYLGLAALAVGAQLGPYAAIWETLTYARGSLRFPVGWYPWPIELAPLPWYLIMVAGFALFGAGAVVAGGDYAD